MTCCDWWSISYLGRRPHDQHPKPDAVPPERQAQTRVLGGWPAAMVDPARVLREFCRLGQLNQTHLENRRSDPLLPRPNFAQTSPPTPSPSTSSLPMRARTIVFERGGSEPRYKWLSSPLARRRFYLPAWARKMSRERGAGGVRSAARNLRFSRGVWFKFAGSGGSDLRFSR